MKLDAPIDITIGPYETYMDEIFGYKAAFEAYVTLRDDEETAKLKMFADHLQEIENNLPLDPKYRNPKIGALAPIRVVNQVLATGDGAHGVRTAAFNLPNDERIVQKMGSKRVMLKNVQEAKFSKTLEPIAKRVLSPADQRDLNFNAFFTHILAHEMTHGIGPQNNVRQSLKELHSAIEEAKADVTGLFMMQYLFDHKLLPPAEKSLYTTFLASSFRTLRFGVHEAHGKGHGAAVQLPDGQGRVRRAAGWDVRGGLRQDPARRARSGARSADHRGDGRLRGREEDAGRARCAAPAAAAGAGEAHGYPDGHRADCGRSLKSRFGAVTSVA